jgi:hypothetical protein
MSTTKMEAAHTSETSATQHTFTQHKDPRGESTSTVYKLSKRSI